MEEKNKNVNEELTEEDLDEVVEDVEEEDSDQVDETTTETKTETKKTQTQEERSYYAKLRRRNKELEEKNKKLEEQVSEADFNSRKKVISEDTLNELGLDSIENTDDLLLCEEYEKAVKRGSENPLLDATRAYRNKVNTDRKKVVEKEKIEAENVKLVNEDKIRFKKKFGIETEVAMKDEKFLKIFGDMISYGNLTELYGKYLMMKPSDDDATNVAKQMGKIPSSTSKPPQKEPDINDLEGEDFLKAFDKKYHR